MKLYDKQLSAQDIDSIAHHIQKHGIPDIEILAEPTQLNGGRSRSTYALETNHGRLVVSCFVPNEFRSSSAHYINSLQHEMHASGVSVPPPIGPLGELADGVQFSVERFMDGHHRSHLSRQQAKNLGNELAKLHKVAQQLEPPPPPEQNQSKNTRKGQIKTLTHTVRRIARGAATANPGTVVNTIEYFSSVVQHKLKKPDLPVQVVHSDIKPSNIVFCDDVPVFLDWDMTKSGHRMEDIAMAIATQFLFPQKNTSGLDDKNIKEFLHAYHEINPLTPEELQALPLAIKRYCFSYGLAEELYGGQTRAETDSVFSSVSAWIKNQDFVKMLADEKTATRMRPTTQSSPAISR